jgi:uncharacterized protein (TIGR02118 family)
VIKHLVTVRARPGSVRDAWARELAAAADARFAWYEIDLAAETDELLARGRRPGRPQAVDALVTLWTGEPQLDLEWLAPLADVVGAVAVTETVHWDDRAGVHAVKQVAFTAPRADLTLEEFAARYREHAPVAREHHPGVRRYVQNFVMEADSERTWAAVAELWFDDEQSYRESFYRDETCREVVAADVARFLDRGGTTSVIVVEVSARRRA